MARIETLLICSQNFFLSFIFYWHYRSIHFPLFERVFYFQGMARIETLEQTSGPHVSRIQTHQQTAHCQQGRDCLPGGADSSQDGREDRGCVLGS